MKKGKKLNRLVLDLILCVLGMLAGSVTVHASYSVNIPVNKTITSLDFNGDGKKDKFKAYNYDRMEGKITFALNGKKKSIFVARGTAINYCKFSNKQIYLFVYMHLFGGGEMTVYRYKGNALKEVKSFPSIFDRTIFDHVKGDYVYLKESPYHLNNISGLSPREGSTGISFIFRYKLNRQDRKFSLSSRYGTPEENNHMYYTGKRFTTSSSPKKIDKKGFTLSPNTWVTLKRVYVKPYKRNGYTFYEYYLQIEQNGKTGWYKPNSSRTFSVSK